MEQQSMEKQYRDALQVTKEIVVKFIEVQRISPGNFAELFPAIYKVVLTSVLENTTGIDRAATGADKK